MATFKQYTAGGGATENFSIKSFAKEEIYVRVDGALKTAGTGTGSGSSHDYEIQSYTANGGTVAWVSGKIPTSPAVVRIYRITDLDPAQATYAAGASIKADDLNDNQEQVLRALREENDQLVQTWDIEDNAITTAKIKDLEIANADISASAEIAVSKLADGSARQVLQTASNGSDVEWTSNVDIPGTLDVTSTAAFDSNVTISGTTTAAAINASGAVGVDGNFDVNTNKFTVAASSGNTVIGGDLDVQGNFEVTGTSLHTGQQTVPGGAQVKNIKVGLDAPNEVSTTSGNLVLDSASGTVQITDHFNVTGNADVDTNLNVDGTLTVDGTSTLTGNTSIGGTLTVTGTTNLAAGSIGNTEIANDAVRTVHILNDNVTSAKINDGAVTTSKLDGGAVTSAKIAANAVTSGALAANAVIADKIATDAVTSVKIQANAVTDGKIAAAAVTSNKIANNAVTTVKIGDNQVTAAKIDDTVIVTNSEQGSHTANDTTFYTTAASDARYYNIGSLEEITSGETWAADDAKIATTAAIDARIVDLVDDVGGFVPIANETSFPSANPDVNNGTGTLVSIKSISSTRTPSGGTVTIANGAGSSTVTITGCGSTVLTAGFGLVVETQGTLHTYAFHRLVPKATEVTTVATNIANVNTCATNIANINTVAADATDIGVVAGKETEIGRLGTADAVADMNTLATTAIVADLETCADNNANISTTAGAISNVNTVAGSISNVNTTAGSIANVNTTAGAIGNVNNVGNNIANVNTVGSNIGTVNDFAARYRGPQNNAGEYTSSLDVGDLYFNTTINALKVYTGSAWIAGVTQTGDYALKTGSTYTGHNTHNDNVKSRYGTGTDLEIYHTGTNAFLTNTAGYMLIDAQGASNDLVLRAGNDVLLQPKNGENGVKVIGDGAVELYHDGNLKINTASYGTQVANGNFRLGDGNSSDASYGRLQFGTDQDIHIYHDGTNSLLDNNTGNLYINSAGDIYLAPNNNEAGLYVRANGACELYQDGVKKLETTSTGINVTGVVVDDGATHDGDMSLNGASYNSWWDKSDNAFKFDDNAQIKLGSDNDAYIMHNGSHQYNRCSTGYYHIQAQELRVNKADGNQYLIRAVAGGTVELYNNGTKTFETTDNGARVVASEGNYAYLYIDADEGDDNADKWRWEVGNPGHKLSNKTSGSWESSIDCTGDGNVKLYYDGSKKLETRSDGILVSGNVQLNDGNRSDYGNNGDLKIYHSSDNNSYIHESGSGHLVLKADDLYIQNAAGSQTNIKSASGGAVELSHAGSKTFETISGGATVTGQLYVTAELNLINGSTNAAKYIDCGLGDNNSLTIRGTSGGDTNHENLARFCRNGNNELFYDNVKKFETASGGTINTGWLQVNGGHVNVTDGNAFRCGDSQDLQIYANGSNSLITHNGDGNLHIEATGSGEDLYLSAADIVYIRTNSSETAIRCVANGAVELYHDNSKKFETNSSGILVRGAEGGSGIVYIYADEGDNDGDKWRLEAEDGGPFTIRNYLSQSWERNIECNGNGNVELWYDNSKKFETTSDGIKTYGHTYTNDANKTYWGNGSDLQIWHDGANNQIKSINGDIVVTVPNPNWFYVKTGSGPDNAIIAKNNAAVELYWDGSKKLETTSGGFKGYGNNYELYSTSTSCALTFKTDSGSNRGAVYADNGNTIGFLRPGGGTWCSRWHSDGKQTSHGHIYPDADNTYDLGAGGQRWRNVYTYDLHLSNEGSQNDVDGTWGSWTIQEGQDDLFLLNNRNGKKYKFNLTEVS